MKNDDRSTLTEAKGQGKGTYHEKGQPQEQDQVEGSSLNKSAGGVKMDIYQSITDRILEAMETAKATGSTKLWDGAGERAGLPLNFSTGKPYTGINVLILWGSASSQGFASNAWMTYAQAKAAGGQVRKGEHGTVCVFYKPCEKDETNNEGETETKHGAVLKSFSVFNLDQVDGIEKPATLTTDRPEFSPLDAAERILSASAAKITMGGTQAYYRRTTDTITLPDRQRFEKAENFYAVACHEIVHSTGHETRLDRQFGKRFGDDAYAMEELVAELGSAFLSAELGLIDTTLENHASYLDSWIRVLKSDRKAIMTAAAQAAKAHAFIMGGAVTQQQEAAA